MKKIIVAIDGLSSCGKSTLAKALAKTLHYAYLDSGAMYRAVTLFFLEKNVDYEDPSAVETALHDIEIHFERIEGQNHTFLNGRDVERDIRTLYATGSAENVDIQAVNMAGGDALLPGVYAISVTGQLDRDIEEDLENRGIRWRCRPATA